MSHLAKNYKLQKYIISNFICPFKIGGDIFKHNILIWMNTIKKEGFKKNSIDLFFRVSKKFDFRIVRKNEDLCSETTNLYIENKNQM